MTAHLETSRNRIHGLGSEHCVARNLCCCTHATSMMLQTLQKGRAAIKPLMYKLSPLSSEGVNHNKSKCNINFIKKLKNKNMMENTAVTNNHSLKILVNLVITVFYSK